MADREELQKQIDTLTKRLSTSLAVFRKQAEELEELERGARQREYNVHAQGFAEGARVTVGRMIAHHDISDVCPECNAEITVPHELLSLAALTRTPTNPCPPARLWHDLRRSVCGHEPPKEPDAWYRTPHDSA